MIIDCPLSIIQLKVLLAIINQIDFDDSGVSIEIDELLLHELLDLVEGDVFWEAF